ncbi:MAG: (2Fe-2S)-binding protein [Bacteroidetes bacterium]|nr:(2Fe-2S)-binding protein [Bacteroidota bacterium]
MKVTIDTIEHEVNGKPTILELASKVGVEIPHFCYHPGLSISGNCRMCLVEAGTPKMGPNGVELDADGKPVIMWGPKPTTSCSTPVSEGMVVKTGKTSKVIEDAQKGVLEFILINHPLDCPICDQAGECPLQENTFKFGPEGSRFEFEKNHKPKRVELGPNVMFDAERCINCTRCVRFSDEVAKAPQLTVIQRGDHNYIATFPGIELDNPYAMNVIDICPVGALTSKHFRFKSRVWEMSETDTICTGCANGCNVKMWVKNNEILRQTPRENQAVNQWWMCDEGRLGFKSLNENRVSGPQYKGSELTWEAASNQLADSLKFVLASELAVVVSPFATLEDNYAAIKFFKKLGVKTFVRYQHVKGQDDHLLIKADKTPNQAALDLLEGIAGKFTAGEKLAASIESGSVKGLVVIEENPFGNGLSESLKSKLSVLVSFSTNWDETAKLADLVIPAASVAETIGTFINAKGIIQKVRPAKALKLQNRSLMRETGLSRWDKHAWKYDKWAQPTHVTDAKPTWEVLESAASAVGVEVSFKSPEQIFSKAASEITVLKDVTYEKIGTAGVQLTSSAKTEAVLS